MNISLFLSSVLPVVSDVCPESNNNFKVVFQDLPRFPVDADGHAKL